MFDDRRLRSNFRCQGSALSLIVVVPDHDLAIHTSRKQKMSRLGKPQEPCLKVYNLGRDPQDRLSNDHLLLTTYLLDKVEEQICVYIYIPIGSMYAIYGNIYHQYTPNVSIYTIHGSYGIYSYIYYMCHGQNQGLMGYGHPTIGDSLNGYY